ncbi:hypothetical protein EDB19DRAFT_1915468 [Suillus lakei]|nr:hypothetical protein EDB19DRAFT_1915468 [Suillus lakei]
MPHRASRRPWDPDSEPVAAEEQATLEDDAYTDLGFPHTSLPVDGIASMMRSSPPQEDNVEWELQNNGLYIGSYSRILLLNAFVPLFAVVIFTVLALLPDLAWPIADFPSPYPTSFLFPLLEILISSAFFSLVHLLRVPLWLFGTSGRER